MLIFYQNLKILVLTGKQLFKYWRKNIPITYLQKMGYLLAKNLNGVSYKLQILHTTKLPRALKKTYIADPVVKMELEIWKYLTNFFLCQNIWRPVLMPVFNSSPNAYFIPLSSQLKIGHQKGQPEESKEKLGLGCQV